MPGKTKQPSKDSGGGTEPKAGSSNENDFTAPDSSQTGEGSEGSGGGGVGGGNQGSGGSGGDGKAGAGGGNTGQGSPGTGTVGNGAEVPGPNTQLSSAPASDDGSSSPLVPILIAIAALAAISIGAVVIRQRRQRSTAGGQVSPRAG